MRYPRGEVIMRISDNINKGIVALILIMCYRLFNSGVSYAQIIFYLRISGGFPWFFAQKKPPGFGCRPASQRETVRELCLVCPVLTGDSVHGVLGSV
jgi:hypothetical protein